MRTGHTSRRRERLTSSASGGVLAEEPHDSVVAQLGRARKLKLRQAARPSYSGSIGSSRVAIGGDLVVAGRRCDPWRGRSLGSLSRVERWPTQVGSAAGARAPRRVAGRYRKHKFLKIMKRDKYLYSSLRARRVQLRDSAVLLEGRRLKPHSPKLTDIIFFVVV